MLLAAQVLGFFVYNFVTNFVLEPTYQTCFNSTLQKLKQDPRITVRLGNDIVGEWAAGCVCHPTKAACNSKCDSFHSSRPDNHHSVFYLVLAPLAGAAVCRLWPGVSQPRAEAADPSPDIQGQQRGGARAGELVAFVGVCCS